VRDGARFANGDLIDEGGVRDECGGGGCVGRSGASGYGWGNGERSWAIEYGQIDFRAHESYGLLKGQCER
jgi:hypothetical protein